MRVPDSTPEDRKFVHSKVERMRPLVNETVSHFREQMMKLSDDVPLTWGYVGGIMAVIDDMLKRCPPECREFVMTNKQIFGAVLDEQREEES